MTRRLLVLVVLAAALAVPALALADDGSTTSTPAALSAPATTARLAPRGRLLTLLQRRLDRRFETFSAHCLVQDARPGCATAAGRFVNRLQRLQGLLQRVETTIAEKCGAANAPARCGRAADLKGRIDALLGPIASDISAIEARYPSAGTATTG